MQMGSRSDPNERFTHYLDKTFKKTASLLAYTCRSVSYCICCVLYAKMYAKKQPKPAGRDLGQN